MKALSVLLLAVAAAAEPKVLWRYVSQTGQLKNAVAVSEGMVIASGLDGVYGLQETDGTVAWHFPAMVFSYGTSPVAVDGVVYFTTMDTDRADYGTAYALDAKTGKAKWSYKLPFQVACSAWVAISGGKMYFVASNGAIYALETATGKLAWIYQTGGEFRTVDVQFVVVDGVAITVDSTILYGLDAETGTLLWNKTFAATNTGIAVDGKGGVVIGVGYTDALCVNASTGATRWDLKGALVDISDFQPLSNNGYLYYGSINGGPLHALQTPDSGPTTWTSVNVQGAITAAPILVDRVLYTGQLAGALVAVNADSGAVQWNLTLSQTEGIYGGLVLEDNVLYATSAHQAIGSSAVYAVKLD